jgi:hypothetical protein
MRLADAFPKKLATRRRVASVRAAKKLVRLYSRTFGIAERIRESVATWPEFPHTVFHCAVCGTKVGRHYPQAGARAWSTNHEAPLHCPTHGQLREFTLNEWLAEWTRRGEPRRLHLPLPPV